MLSCVPTPDTGRPRTPTIGFLRRVFKPPALPARGHGSSSRRDCSIVSALRYRPVRPTRQPRRRSGIRRLLGRPRTSVIALDRCSESCRSLPPNHKHLSTLSTWTPFDTKHAREAITVSAAITKTTAALAIAATTVSNVESEVTAPSFLPYRDTPPPPIALPSLATQH